jgi:hypothetical protein
MTPNLTRRAVLAAALASLIAGTSLAPTTMAAGGKLYVDGKNGRDANGGLGWDTSVKTIQAAARKVPIEGAAAGWTVIVRGYSDYVYRERPIPGGYRRYGTSSAPLAFQAEGWAPGGSGYVRPIVSGGERAPAAGKSWTSRGGGVWSTPWSTPPAQFSSSKAFGGALFQNDFTWLWQRQSLNALTASVTSDKIGGYWWASGTLYVATLGGVVPCGNGSNPTNCARIEVPTHNGFFFDGAHGAKHVQVSGFHLRHFNVAIAFVGGTDYSSAYDNVVEATSGAGINVSGANADPAVGNRIERNIGRLNTIQAIKVNPGSHGTRVCSNEAYGNGLQGIKVQGPFDGATDPRVTKDTLICENRLHGQNFARPDKAASYANGLTVSDGALSTTVRANRIWNNAIGINLAQNQSTGRPLEGTLIEHNLVSGNRREGLLLGDGVKKASAGSGTVTSRFNLYWGNDIGIGVSTGSTRKFSINDTIYKSRSFGYRVGCACTVVTADIRIEKVIVVGSGKHGVFVRSGGKATLSYVGLSGNAGGNTKGKLTVSPIGSVNGQPAGFLSVDAASPAFLRISSTSYQHTAGPNGTPIGARY